MLLDTPESDRSLEVENNLEGGASKIVMIDDTSAPADTLPADM